MYTGQAARRWPVVLDPSSVLLQRALDELEKHGWCREAMVLGDVRNGEDPSSYRVCLTAALIMATGFKLSADTVIWEQADRRIKGSGNRVYARTSIRRSAVNLEVFFRNLHGPQRTRFVKLIRYLREVTGADDLQEWNDHPDRSYDDVVVALQSAIALATSQGD